MAGRFIDASEEAYKIMNEVRKEYFPLLEKAIITVLFDTRKRTRGNKLVLGRMQRANDLIRKLTDNLAEEGCDYIMFLDQVAFCNIPEIDKIRLVRHELRHCKVTGTEEKLKYKIVPHDIEDFVVECELNKDDIGWGTKAAELALLIYDQKAEQTKEEQQQTVKPKKRAFFNKPAPKEKKE